MNNATAPRVLRPVPHFLLCRVLPFAGAAFTLFALLAWCTASKGAFSVEVLRTLVHGVPLPFWALFGAFAYGALYVGIAAGHALALPFVALRAIFRGLHHVLSRPAA
jgi:hypothetical protein